ncbi:hypothetical protein [Blastopirellula marina]|uniref:Leucine-rich repeat domain-containing protein n=1 Tax=Blastopirellula marina TaxID=124 RepID=A0A2S8G6M1_9BACT|nr:hypothetical protein [Blastopirellula marina]PQO40115.1 hypothetical protein C5Y98_07115 [Blastopirellula marina]PQO43793.1 hypothetical protein C5Y93_23625 [Blastopirellula marina]PTL45490.1 hypothetical protein C5Y97_07115 [Blastopirellula marina]
MEAAQPTRPVCHCLDAQYGDSKWTELQMHVEQQDVDCEAWQRLNELIDAAIRDGREEISFGQELGWETWTQIIELPASIAKLKQVKRLVLYGSGLVRIPPEIGEMESLEIFQPYTSYRLHWLPYEIRRCRKLGQSTISTRALYGNYKHRPPFPALPQLHPSYLPKECSICREPLTDTVLQRWVTLRIATDVVPLLVHACSEKCVAAIPTPPENYVQTPHEGGLQLQQPASGW